MKFKKGDHIKIISGKDRGRTAAVLRVLPSEDLMTAEGVNVYKKRVRPKQQGQKGETISVPRPFPASRALLVCGGCKKATRVGFRFEENRKVRYCKNCKAPV